MATTERVIAADPQAARDRLARLVTLATSLEAAGDRQAAAEVWDEHHWASNALRTPEDLLAEGLDLIAAAQMLTAAATTARPYRSA
ncbi:MAG: hypothetical protein WC558_04095 [Patulibacter sp.]